jgi:hypothetical protein
MLGNVGADFVDIVERFRVERLTAHAGRGDRCACVFFIKRR